MKKDRVTLRTLSEKTGLSTSTLSRALNNCPGVDWDTRRLAREAARKFGYIPPPKENCSIGVLFPTTPDYFWGTALSAVRTVLQETGTDFRLMVYPSLARPAEICELVDSMLDSGVRILLMPIQWREVSEYLDAKRDTLTVFQICDYGEIRNSFVFTSDGEADGAELARILHQYHPGSRALILSVPTLLCRARTKGFVSRYPSELLLGELELPSVPPQRRAAAYARMLMERAPQPPDILVCNTGILPYMAQALVKCGWKGRTLCAGFEYPPDLNRHISSGICAVVEQDITGESTAAALAAEQFRKTGIWPDRKFTCIPSKFYIIEKEKE